MSMMLRDGSKDADGFKRAARICKRERVRDKEKATYIDERVVGAMIKKELDALMMAIR